MNIFKYFHFPYFLLELFIIFLGVTCHYFDHLVNLKHRTLTIRLLPGSHSNETIAGCLAGVLAEFDITSKVRAMTLDNARNCIHVSDTINKKLNLNSVQFSCGCHIINLIVKKVLALTSINLEKLYDEDEDDEWVLRIDNSEVIINRFKELIKKCRHIASKFHQSNQMNESLAKAQSSLPHLTQRKIIQEVAHRWNSMYLMVLAILRNHEVNYIFIFMKK